MKKLLLILSLGFFLFSANPAISYANNGVGYGSIGGSAGKDAKTELEQISRELLRAGIIIVSAQEGGAIGGILAGIFGGRLADLTVDGILWLIEYFRGNPPTTLAGIDLYFAFLHEANRYLFGTLVELRREVMDRDTTVEDEIKKYDELLGKLCKSPDDPTCKIVEAAKAGKQILVFERDSRRNTYLLKRKHMQLLSMDISIIENQIMMDLMRTLLNVYNDLIKRAEKAQNGMGNGENEYERQRIIFSLLQTAYNMERKIKLDKKYMKEKYPGLRHQNLQLFWDIRQLAGESGESFSISEKKLYKLYERVKKN